MGVPGSDATAARPPPGTLFRPAGDRHPLGLHPHPRGELDPWALAPSSL